MNVLGVMPVKGRAEKKEEPKESPAPAAPVTAPPPQVAAPSPRKTAAGIPPPPREKPMQLEEIVAALQQIETLMAEPSVASPSDDSGSSDRLQTVAMSLRDIAEVVPSSFIDTKFTAGEKADVVIEDLFGQMAKGKIETTLGYLLAGVMIGPATPGFVADVNLAGQLAEIGVMLLMFGVGLHFSLDDLLAVKRIAVPGAIVQIAVATAMGMGLTMFWGWEPGAALVFGLALSVASTVVLLRALEARGGIRL